MTSLQRRARIQVLRNRLAILDSSIKALSAEANVVEEELSDLEGQEENDVNYGRDRRRGARRK